MAPFADIIVEKTSDKLLSCIIHFGYFSQKLEQSIEFRFNPL